MLAAFFMDLSPFELVFFWIAAAGGGIFVLRVLLMMLGGDFNADADFGDFGDVGDVGDIDAGADHASSDASFNLLSLEALSGFFLMFGLVGLATSKTTDFHEAVVVLCGTVAGMITILMLQKIFGAIVGMQSSGTLDYNNAVGTEGKVYLTIKPGDTGKIEVVVQDRLQHVEAITNGEEELKTGERVKVVEITPTHVFVVEKV